MHAGYSLEMTAPPPADYVRLRREAGLSEKSEQQARAALPGSWAVCRVVEERSGETVGMGRVIGDGGWYFHIADMAVLPAHQRKGIGDAILGALIERVREAAPPDAYVNLLADPPGRRLYENHGFRESAPESVGMVLDPAPNPPRPSRRAASTMPGAGD